MKITYFTHSPLEYKTKTIYVGQKIIGLRILSLEIESQIELETLLSEKGSEWAKKHLKFNTYTKLTPIEKESNWGSDWVDDGV